MADRSTQFTDLIDLAAERAGALVLLANDEFFAPKEALLKSTPAEWREGVYTEHGKWMGDAPPPHTGPRLVHR